MKYPLFLLLLIVLVACKDDDVVSNRPVFTLTFDNASDPFPNVWVVLRDDETGELIDSRVMENNKSNVFESTKRIKSGKMTVTIFRSGSNASIQVFSGIEVGTEWNRSQDGRYQKSDPNPPASGGQYNLKITNVPPLYAFSVSDKYGSQRLNVDAKYEDGTITIMPGFSTGYKQLVAIDPQVGKQKYAYVEDISGGQDVTLDYSDFKEYDSYIHLGISGTKEEIVYGDGYEVAKYYNGYDTYSLYYGGYGDNNFVKQDMNIGVLKDLPIYRVRLYNGNAEFNYYGPVPTKTLNLPHAEIQVADASLDNFKITGTQEYNYSTVSFVYYPTSGTDTIIFVDFYSPQGDFTFFDPLTDEIVSKYSLKMDAIRYSNMIITAGSRTYANQLDVMFKADYDWAQPHEYWSMYVSQSR